MTTRATSAVRWLCAIAAGVAFSMISPGSSSGFGTYSDIPGQHGEHMEITRAALMCGVNGDPCFEPQMMTYLAGAGLSKRGLGYVDRPDSDVGKIAASPESHCDDADFLDVPDYPQSRAAASKALLACRRQLKDQFDIAVARSADLVDVFGRIPLAAVLPCERSLAVRCDVLARFGETLHGVQDFYSHSNWADEADPHKPISITNPPGLDQRTLTPLFDFTKPAPAIPSQLATGCYVPAGTGCSGRITHEILTKDDGKIDDKGTATNPTKPRGQIGSNFAKAVASAIAETRRQWAALGAALRNRYGQERGDKMICVLSHDDPKRSCEGKPPGKPKRGVTYWFQVLDGGGPSNYDQTTLANAGTGTAFAWCASQEQTRYRLSLTRELNHDLSDGSLRIEPSGSASFGINAGETFAGQFGRLEFTGCPRPDLGPGAGACTTIDTSPLPPSLREIDDTADSASGTLHVAWGRLTVAHAGVFGDAPGCYNGNAYGGSTGGCSNDEDFDPGRDYSVSDLASGRAVLMATGSCAARVLDQWRSATTTWDNALRYETIAGPCPNDNSGDAEVRCLRRAVAGKDPVSSYTPPEPEFASFGARLGTSSRSAALVSKRPRAGALVVAVKAPRVTAISATGTVRFNGRMVRLQPTFGVARRGQRTRMRLEVPARARARLTRAVRRGRRVRTRITLIAARVRYGPVKRRTATLRVRPPR